MSVLPFFLDSPTSETKGEAMKFWVCQMGRGFWLEKAADRPALKGPGNKKVVIVASYDTEASAKNVLGRQTANGRGDALAGRPEGVA